MTEPKPADEVKDTTQEVEDTGAETTNTEVEKDSGNDEMISKADAQKMADAFAAKKLKGMPSKEELAAYKKWQDDQKTAEEKRAEEVERLQTIEAENNTLKQERTIRRKGVAEDDVEYVHFKVSKMDGEDFDEKLEDFLKENPKYLAQDGGTTTTTGVPVKKGETSASNTSVRDLLKQKHPDLNI